MYDALRDVLYSNEFSVIERFEVPGRAASDAPIPRFLFDSRVGSYLGRHLNHRENPLWAHQARALEELGHGRNVVVSTGTASGKSLVFMSFAFHTTLLNPKSRILVLYPLKALAADQLRGWRKMARSLELDETYIGRIDGSVPVNEREKVLRNARIVMMTPDVCHAWLMFRLSSPVVRRFVQALTTVVMDEAHTLEGVFGSNFAFLIRRLLAARNLLLLEGAETPPLGFVAATATIKEPGDHLRKITGKEFSVVDHESDGAPQHQRLVAHIACPSGEEMLVAKALQDCVLDNGKEGGFITFLDSRKGVESLAMASGDGQEVGELDDLLSDTNVLPYRAGYDAKDRQRIEQRLQSGSLRGVISTSALELGIDIPHLRVGFNTGVPETRKGYRQRLGRVGRSGPGAFVVIAPPSAFRGYGTSFQEYHEMSVEASYLYLDNRFMQFAHARCLAVELESLGASAKTPTRIAWPAGFSEVHAAARPGGNRLPEFDAIASLGGDNPHHGYPLRNLGEITYEIKQRAEGDVMGNISQLQALRECYPGATYLHLAKAYKVAAWHTSSFENFIRVKPASPNRRTRPRIATWINTGITSSDIQENHLMRSNNGFLAECSMLITERVEGYVDVGTGAYHPYQTLQQRDPNMRARMRNFRTTGVVLCIEEGWFKGSPLKTKFADRLRDVFAREYSISPRELGSAGTKISVRSMDTGSLRGTCVAVYDEVYGSLRLTERLYLEFARSLERLAAAVSAGSEDNEGLPDFVARIREEFREFGGMDVEDQTTGAHPKGYEYVFAPGSRVCFQQAGQMAADVEIVQPALIDGELMYQVKEPQRPGQRPVRRYVRASAVEPSADADSWNYSWWNRESQEYEETPEEDAS